MKQQEFQRKYDEVLKIFVSEIETNKTIMCDESNHIEIAKMMQDAIIKIPSHIYHNIDDFYLGNYGLIGLPKNRSYSSSQTSSEAYVPGPVKGATGAIFFLLSFLGFCFAFGFVVPLGFGLVVTFFFGLPQRHSLSIIADAVVRCFVNSIAASSLHFFFCALVLTIIYHTHI